MCPRRTSAPSFHNFPFFPKLRHWDKLSSEGTSCLNSIISNCGLRSEMFISNQEILRWNWSMHLTCNLSLVHRLLKIIRILNAGVVFGLRRDHPFLFFAGTLAKKYLTPWNRVNFKKIRRLSPNLSFGSFFRKR